MLVEGGAFTRGGAQLQERGTSSRGGFIHLLEDHSYG
jgi:hypothetical protein